MYEDFYKLSGRPFQLTPDYRFFYDARPHKKALAYLNYGISQGDGFIVITGDIGAGKTTLVDYILSTFLGRNLIAVKVVSTQLDADDMLRTVAEKFDIAQEGADKATVLKRIEAFLVENRRIDKPVLLFVDEAQNLPYDTLKTIHHLFNFTTKNGFLLQMALIGQPELHKRIKRFISLSSRMYMTKLQPFDFKQTEEMMQFRWTVPGGKKLPFEKQAIAEIYRLTSGIARGICKLANEALLRAVIEKKKVVDRDTVIAAAADAFEEV